MAVGIRAVLESEGPHHTWKLPSDQQELLEEIARLSKNDPAVARVIPDLLGSLEKIMTELDSSLPDAVVRVAGGGPVKVSTAIRAQSGR